MSHTLEALQRKIKGGKDLGSIVSTMKSLAATSVIQYEQAVEALSKYYSTIEMGLSVVLKDIQTTKDLTQRKNKNTLVIIFGSDHSLVGRFNEQIVNYALYDLFNLKANTKENHVFYFTVGEQIVNRLYSNGIKADHHFDLPSSVMSITDAVLSVLSEVEAYQDKHQVEDVLLVFNQPKKGASYQPNVQVLFPVDLDMLSKKGKKWKSNSIPTYRVDAHQLLSSLLQQYFFIILYQTFAYSLAAENSARLVAMQQAEKNIEELLSDLNIQYQQARQSEITDELLDIIAGFKSLRKTDY
jgi:F-type H+-transporting ATPase subunit gamma